MALQVDAIRVVDGYTRRHAQAAEQHALVLQEQAHIARIAAQARKREAERPIYTNPLRTLPSAP